MLLDVALLHLPRRPRQAFCELNVRDLFYIVPDNLRTATDDLREKGLSILHKSKSLAWIAGGAIRSRIANDGPTDLDCYFTNNDDLEITKDFILSKNSLKSKSIIDDKYLVCIDTSIGKIDLVKKFYPTPLECISEFDFTVCCFALDTSGIATWHKDALEHIKDRKLVLNHVTCAFSSMLRLQKYAAKGYRMDLENANKLALKIKENTWDKTLNKLVGRNNSINCSA